jgi:tetratricopeptide (TPR) repeat protein
LSLDKLKQYLVRGEYRQARREAEYLIYLGDLKPFELVQAYRGAALAYYFLQEVIAATKLGEKALELAVKCGNRELIGKSRYDLGEFYLKVGDTHLAKEHLLQFLNELPLYPTCEGLEAKAHHNLALIFRQRRDHEQALTAHQKAATLFEQQGDSRQMMEALRGIIWCHLANGQPHAAWPFIQRISTYLQEHQDDGLSTSQLTDLAYYHRLIGNVHTSMDFCEEALIPDRPGVDEHILATACVIAGENALDVQHTSEARMFATLALDYALKARHPVLMNRASALRRRIRGAASSSSLD